MKKKRRVFTNEFKLKVILETLKERSTAKELCQKYELHPNQISKWKEDFLDKAVQIMDSKSEKTKNENYEAEQNRLYTKIGQLQMEIDFLKKSCAN